MISHLFAQAAQSSCTLNGQPIDCAVLAEKAKPFLGLGVSLLVIFLLLALVSFVFWLWMLIHAIKHNSPDRTMWIAVLVVSFLMGFGGITAFIYLFAEKKKAEQAVTAINTQPPSNQNQPNDATPPQINQN